MKGTATDTVASSWIEALGGVSMCWILSTPPDFCAATGAANSSPASTSRVIRPFLAFIVSSLDDLDPSPSLARGVTRGVSRGDACLPDFAPGCVGPRGLSTLRTARAIAEETMAFTLVSNSFKEGETLAMDYILSA